MSEAAIALTTIKGLLGDLLPLKYGKSLPASSRDPSGSVPVFGSSGVVGTHAVALTTGPAIIVGRKGNVGAVHYSATPCWPIDTAYFAEPPVGHSLVYYRYLLQSLNLVRLDKSTAIPGLSRDDYNAVEVVIHSPELQGQVVAEIDKQFSRLDEAVANLQRVKANLKRYKAAVLKAAVEGRLVETEASHARCEGRSYETGAQLLQRTLEARRSQWAGRGKFKEPAAPAADEGALPEGWAWTSIDQVAEVGTGATPSRSNPSFWDNGDVPWVTSAVANADFVDAASEFVTQRALAETNLTLYPAGTLLLAMYGEGKTRGKCSELRIPAATNQALAALCLPAEIRGYVRHFLELNYEEMRKVASGGVQPNLNLSLVRAVQFPLPPAAEQRRIVAEVDRRLSILRGVEAEVDANLKRAQALRQSVLAKAFSS